MSLLSRRETLLMGTLAPLFASTAAQAQPAWPTQPIRLIVPFAPGGATDVAARLIADGLSRELPQRVFIENKTGSGAVVGTEAVARANDGHTFLYAVVAHATLKASFPNLRFDPEKDFAPVALCGIIPKILIVNPTLPGNLQEFVALVRQNPGKYNYGSAGLGTSTHFAPELFLKMAGNLKVTHVPYRGAAAAVPDLLSGTLSMMINVAPDAIPYIQDGKVKGLAVTGKHRLQQIPDVPTFAEAGMPDFEAYTWHMIMAPAGAPRSTVDIMNTAVNKVLADPGIKERLSEIAMQVRTDSTPESATQWLRSETEKWDRVLREAGLAGTGN